MNNAVMVDNLFNLNQQKGECKSNDSELSDKFKDALAELMDGDNVSISVKQTTVTGTAVCGSEGLSPHNASLKSLTSQLYEMMDAFFEKHNIRKDPPVRIEYSYVKTEVQIVGDREDVEEIQRLINEDPDIKGKIQKVLAIASHVINMAETLAFQNEYRKTDDPKAVVDKFNHLFDEERHMHRPTLEYGEESFLLSDGKKYHL